MSFCCRTSAAQSLSTTTGVAEQMTRLWKIRDSERREQKLGDADLLNQIFDELHIALLDALSQQSHLQLALIAGHGT